VAKGIYKRGGVYWIRYAGLDGKIIFESTHSDRFKDAVTRLTDQKKSVRDGKQPDIKKKIPNTLFKDLVTEYLKWSERQRSHEQKEINANQLIEEFGNIPLRYFSTMMLEQYQTKRLEKGNKPATVNRHIALIKHMFTKAVEWDMVEEEALKRVRRVKLLEENNRRLRYLSVDECQTLLDECEKLGKKNAHYAHLKPIVIMALNTGMRKGEILTLTWDNVDLKHGFILLDKTKNGDRREIPINETLRETLQGIVRRLDGGHAFYDTTTGKPFRNVTRSFATACRNAKVKDFRFHDLRHTFASHLVMAGVDITTVSRLLGHKNLTMTLRYAHLSPNHMSKAVDILDSTLKQHNEVKEITQVR